LKHKTEATSENAIDLTILFDLSEDIQCILNTCGSFEKVNKRLISESQFTEPELLGNSFLSILSPADRERVDNILLSLLSGKSHQFEARLLQSGSDGSLYAWRCQMADGNIYLTARCVSNQPVQKLEPNDQNDHRFKALVQNSSDLLAILSGEGEYQYVSPTVKRILGFDPEHFLGKTAFEFIHPEDIPRLLPLFEKLKTNYKLELPAYRFLSSDGKWHWLETVATNLLHDPAINGVVVNSRDITLHRELEDDILRNSKRFNNLIENNQDGCFILNRDWRFTSINTIVRNATGLPADMKIGANIWKAIPHARRSNFYSQFTRAFEQNVAVHFKEFSPLFNKWFEVNAYPFEDSLTVIIRDITASKIQHLTQALEKAVLEMNAASVCSLNQVMDHLLSGFEKIHYGLKTSLSVVDKLNSNLTRISAPGMPELYHLKDIKSQLPQGKSPCSQAAFQGIEIYVEDIFAEETAADYREILLNYNIRSSRSIPVMNKNKEVIGVFTIFNNGHKHALVEETSLINRLGTIIQLLLENTRAKEDVERSNERFQLTMEATSDSLWDFDLRTKQIYRGNGFDKFFNQEEGFESIDAKKWETNIHPDDAKEVDNNLEESLKNPKTKNWTAEYRYLKKDGTYAHVIDKGFIIRDNNQKAIRIVGALQDITEIKKNQERLIQSEENYKNMFFNNPSPMWTYDMETRCFSMVNDAALKLYGYTREEFMRLDLFAIRIEEDHEKLREHLKSKPFLEDLNISQEWTHLKKDKTPITVDVVSHPVLINGRRSRLVAIKDITQKKKDRQEILEQNKRLREIAQISSHETRKPLASILGLVNLFDKENPANPLNKEIVQYLEITANELDTVVHNIVKKTWLESEASSAFRAE
jgi:PAS domain S-box-containing protein